MDTIDILLSFLGLLITGVAVTITLLTFYRNSKENEKVAEITREIVVLKSVFHRYLEVVNLVSVRDQKEKNMEVQEKRMSDLQAAYKETLIRMHDSIERLFREGTIMYLFPPPDSLFLLLTGMVTWLKADLQKESVLLGSDRELIIPQNYLITSVKCLQELSKIEEKKLKKSVKLRLKTFTNPEEIASVQRKAQILRKLELGRLALGDCEKLQHDENHGDD